MRLSLAIRSPTCFDRRPDHHQAYYEPRIRNILLGYPDDDRDEIETF
jgi:hypothetical protein